MRLSRAAFLMHLPILTPTRVSILSLCVLAAGSTCYAQSTAGFPPFATVHSGPVDVVKVNDGSVLINIPIKTRAGLIPFSYSLVGNFSFGGGGRIAFPSGIQPTATGGVATAQPTAASTTYKTVCPNGKTSTTVTQVFSFTDALGTKHPITGIQADSAGCLPSKTAGYAADGSGVYATFVLGFIIGSQNNATVSSIIDKAGSTYNFVYPNFDYKDTNGNTLSYSLTCIPSNCSGNPFYDLYTYMDPSGANFFSEKQQWQTVNGLLMMTADSYQWTDAAGNQQAYTSSISMHQFQTNFGCPTNDGPLDSSLGMPAVDSISTPDGTYTIQYEQTVGLAAGISTSRISEIKFPTGASIQYTYTGGNSGMTCGLGTVNNGPNYGGEVPILTRIITDVNGKTGKWVYDTTQIANATVVTDPGGNDTVYTFATDAYGNRQSLETEKIAYQGSWRSNVPLLKTITCYNGATQNWQTSCPAFVVSPPVVVTQTDRYTAPAGMTTFALSEMKYDSYGNLTEDTDYDYNGTLISDRILTYGTYSNGSCTPIGSFIVNRVCTDVTKVGATVAAQTNYTYDSHGNQTAINRLVGGSTYLTSSATYNANGTASTTYDINSAQTTYTYGACNGTLPTTINEPLGLSRSMTWDCNGAVVKTQVDENNQTTTYGYVNPSSGLGDPYYRYVSLTDPLGNITNFTYTPTTVESAMKFNAGSSTSDTLVTTDGLGHQLLVQKRQAPGSSTFDTVQYTYDGNGRLASTSLPCATAAGVGCSTPVTTQVYDGLSRTTQITDGGGGYVSYNYAPAGLQNNDVLVTVGPAPTGEHAKQRQLEYDALGRLTSVCEVTATLPGNGTCAQGATQTGYWAKYSYDALGDLLTVTQNAQASSGNQQTRTLTYDAMRRLTSEKNPEMNQVPINYTYDTDSACGTSSGDLVKRVDAIGNKTCYSYDALHRPLSKTYTVTSPTVATPNKCFVYDAAIDSNTVTNTKGRLAEAYTTTSACSQTTLPSNTTDVAFGYSGRGEIVDVYEKTPHSGGTGAPYNHTNASFWPSGGLNTLGGPVMPTLTYAVDSGGRTTTVSASSGPNPVTSATYSPYATPPQLKVTFGSTDSDVFSFDASTLRLTKYQFNIGPKTVTGTLSWNSNGSLGSLAINDAFSAANTQTCNYTADDLARISKGDCGTIWGQTFAYDPFGNVQKTAISGEGGTTFAPCYQVSPSITNRIALVGGTGSNCTGGTAPTYDPNGNSINDSFRSFSYDAENRPVAIGAVSLTYDALGHAAELNVSSSNTEIVYTPLGDKLALMNGISLVKAFAPLTGGATAVYTSSSGPAYYRHKDHLGSSRFASTPSQTSYSDTAYSPFGEPYAGSGAIDSSFTGQNQDTLTGVYDFLYREHDPNQGRWTQPDPAGLAAVDPTDPQSWNRYAYLTNGPLNATDSDGTGPCFYSVICSGNPGQFLQLDEFDLLSIAFAPQVVVTGWTLVGVQNDTTMLLGGCGDFPNCFTNEVPVYGTIYPNIGVLGLQQQQYQQQCPIGVCYNNVPLPPTTGPKPCVANCHAGLENYKKPLNCLVDPCTPEQKKQWCAGVKETAERIERALNPETIAPVGPIMKAFKGLEELGKNLTPVTVGIGLYGWDNQQMAQIAADACKSWGIN